MGFEFSTIELEKIRYQMGQIIKSWSKVERTIEDDYVGYTVGDNHPDKTFAILFDDKLLLLTKDTSIIEKVRLNYVEISKFDPIPQISEDTSIISLSLQEYRFTELLPTVQVFYQSIILHH